MKTKTSINAPFTILMLVLFFFCRNLENLGTLSYKMRIQANDDVYETTRHRMAVAEENNKNKW